MVIITYHLSVVIITSHLYFNLITFELSVFTSISPSRLLLSYICICYMLYIIYMHICYIYHMLVQLWSITAHMKLLEATRSDLIFNKVWLELLATLVKLPQLKYFTWTVSLKLLQLNYINWTTSLELFHFHFFSWSISLGLIYSYYFTLTTSVQQYQLI